MSGGMMISRYHQINRIFITDDTPDYEDHNFNLPGCNICVSGYMSLEFNSKDPIKEQVTSENSFTEVDFNINEDPFEAFLKTREVEDITGSLYEIITAIDEEYETVGNKENIKGN